MKLHIASAYIVFLVLFIQCSRLEGERYVLNMNSYKLNSYDDDIFPPEFLPYSPSVEEVERSEAIAIQYLKSYNDSTGQNLNISDYGKQFIAAKDSTGSTFMYINCFCDPKTIEYRKRYLVVVTHGGQCYIQIKVNLTSNKVDDLSWNSNG